MIKERIKITFSAFFKFGKIYNFTKKFCVRPPKLTWLQGSIMSDSLIVKCIIYIVHYFDMSWNKAYIVAINQYYNVFGQVPELTYARGWLLHVYFIIQ